jgi:hypothetical protein
LAKYFCLLRITKDPGNNWGKRMRLKNDLFAPQSTPAADMALACLYKINGPFVFGTPATLRNLVTSFVDLDEASGGENGIHSQVFAANVPIGEVYRGKLLQISQGHNTPLLHHAAEI